MSLDSVEHVLFECDCINLMRDAMWSNMLRYTGRIGKELYQMNNVNRVKFILNATNIEYIEEWNDTYDYILQFIHRVYNAWMLMIL